MTPSLLVHRAELDAALKSFAKFLRRKKNLEAVLTFREDLLCIEMPGIIQRVPAQGDWPGQARVGHNFLTGLAGQLPPGEPLELKFDDRHLYLGRLRVSAVWEGAEGIPIPIPVIQLPLGPKLLELLILPYLHTEEEIRLSGLLLPLKQAEQERNRRIYRAAQVLEPIGVTEDDVSEIVDAAVRRKANVDHPEPEECTTLEPTVVRPPQGEVPLGWQRPRQHVQHTLFTVDLERALLLLGIRREQARAWFEMGWLSFDPDTCEAVDEPDLLQLRFIAGLSSSGLPPSVVTALLKQLPRPYCYDPLHTAYRFDCGWIATTPSLQEDIARQIEYRLESWLAERVRAGDTARLARIQDCISALLPAGSQETSIS